MLMEENVEGVKREELAEVAAQELAGEPLQKLVGQLVQELVGMPTQHVAAATIQEVGGVSAQEFAQPTWQEFAEWPTEAPPSRDLYIVGVLPDITEDRLKEIFLPYGDVTWCKVLGARMDGKGAALLEFASVEQATWVVENMQGSIPPGLTETIDVKFKHSPDMKWQGGKGKGKSKNRFSPYDSTGFADWFINPSDSGSKNGSNERRDITVPASDNIYVRGLPSPYTEEQLRQTFGEYAQITSCKILHGQLKTSALIRYKTVAEATSVVNAMQGVTLPGLTEPLEVRFADTPATRAQRLGDGTPYGIMTVVNGFESSGLMPGGTYYNQHNSPHALYVAGLPSDCNDYYLYRLFTPLGPIAPRGVRTLTNDDGSCKGIAFVNYLDAQSAQQAITVYNGTMMPDGHRLKVLLKTPKVEPSAVA